MKIRVAVWMSLAVLSILIGGCSESVETPNSLSNMQVVTTREPQAIFPKSAKYVFLRSRPEDSQLDEETQIVLRRLRDAIKSELKSKGYKPGGETVDYIVDYQLVYQHNISVLSERVEREGDKWVTVVGGPDTFVQGALVIDVIDAKDLTLVWRGLCNADIALADISDEERDRRAKYAVHELLDEFPPKN